MEKKITTIFPSQDVQDFSREAFTEIGFTLVKLPVSLKDDVQLIKLIGINVARVA